MSESEVKYYFTGYQLSNEREQIPYNTFIYDTVEEYKTKYATEMNYAIAAVDSIAGYLIIVYDSNGSLLVHDIWFRQIVDEEAEA